MTEKKKINKDDHFTLRPGKPGYKVSGSYLSRIKNAMGQAGFSFPLKLMKGAGNFTGARSGRGYVTGRFSARHNDHSGTHGNRRVIVKFRSVKSMGRGGAKAAAHLRYIQRDGVSRDGTPGKLYNEISEEADGKEFQERTQDDRHQFRIIISPEDAIELDSLTDYTRDLMAQMEKDLGTKLDWLAVNHFNTDNPHVHIVLRGKDDKGQDLVIARDYITHGIRIRAQEIATIELGPRHSQEIRQAMLNEIKKDRFTDIDYQILKNRKDGLVNMRHQPTNEPDRFRHTLHIGRLQKLETMGLAHETGTSLWQLHADMEMSLRDMGKRGDIISMMHFEMKRAHLDILHGDYDIFRPEEQSKKTITGRILSKGLSDELYDRYYLVIESMDGKNQYVDIGQADDIDNWACGHIIEVKARTAAPRQVDKTIATVASKNSGFYSAEFHETYDPNASPEFIQSHIRRLEVLRRSHVVERLTDGRWHMRDDFLENVTAYEKNNIARQPVRLKMLSTYSLDAQISAVGATWLDHTLIGASPATVGARGFGRQVKKALLERETYLVKQGLAVKIGNTIRYRQGLLLFLEQQELQKTAAAISEQSGKKYIQHRYGEKVEGVYKKHLMLISGKYALLEKQKEFTLVPWRPVLDRALGKSISGIIRGASISWDIGKQRGRGISI